MLTATCIHVRRVYFFVVWWPFPEQQILDCFKSKTSANEKFNTCLNEFMPSDRTENLVGKGENASNQHFVLFPQGFQSLLFQIMKTRDYVVKS